MTFFFSTDLLFPIFIWTFISFFYLDFRFPFLFGLLFLFQTFIYFLDFYFIFFTFISLFALIAIWSWISSKFFFSILLWYPAFEGCFSYFSRQKQKQISKLEFLYFIAFAQRSWMTYYRWEKYQFWL
jgi:hypothetical protein